MKIGYTVLILLLSFTSLSFGQKKKVKNGYEKGLLVDGYKEGIWEYYKGNVLKIKVDYTTRELIYLAKDTLSYAIKSETGWEMSKLDIPPHYIGSEDEIIKILAMNIRYPFEARTQSTIGTVLLGFEINLQGHVENVKILRDIGNGCGDKVLKAFQLIPDVWLVAQKDGKNFKSRYILPVTFRIVTITSKGDELEIKPETESTELKESKTAYHPTNYLEEIIITAVRSY